MKFFVDTCDIAEIEELHGMGLVDGVTTNPSIIAKSGQDLFQVLKDICKIVKTSVSAEVVATHHQDMVAEGKKLAEIGSQIAIKVPLTWDGLKACKSLSDDGHKVNVTLCFSPAQALMAAKAGATYVSPFVGRLDDIGHDGMDLIEDICHMFANYPELETQVLAASIRNPLHVIQAAKIGADIATVPPKVLKQLIKHPLTDNGLDAFLKDWEATGQKIKKSA